MKETTLQRENVYWCLRGKPYWCIYSIYGFADLSKEYSDYDYMERPPQAPPPSDHGSIGAVVKCMSRTSGHSGPKTGSGCRATPFKYPSLWIQPPRFNTLPGHIIYTPY